MSLKMIENERAAALSNSPGDFFDRLLPRSARHFLSALMSRSDKLLSRVPVATHAFPLYIKVYLKNPLRLHHGVFSFFRYTLQTA